MTVVPFTTRVREGSRTYLYVCYLYAVKFIWRLGHRPPWGFTCGSIPARVYTYLTPGNGRKDRASQGGIQRRGEERRRRDRARAGVPHLHLHGGVEIQLAVSTGSGPANDLPNFMIPELGSGRAHRDFRLRIVFNSKRRGKKR